MHPLRPTLLAPPSSRKSLAWNSFNPQRSMEGITVELPPEVVDEGAQHWSLCLVGHFVVKKLSFAVVNSIAKKLWIKEGLYEVLAYDHNYFFFKFSSESGFLS